MKCFYHTDMDGKCSAAIVHYFYSLHMPRNMQATEANAYQRELAKTYYAINYNIDFPFDVIEPGEEVIIVDFSLQKAGDFERLLEITRNVIWIDHHKSAIEKHAHLDNQIAGIRRDGIAACELTWKYFFPNREVPRVVQLLGDYDVWKFAYGSDTRHLQSGIRLLDNDPWLPSWAEWFRDGDAAVSWMIDKGIIANQYRDNYYAGLIRSWSFQSEFEGYSAVCCNAGSVSSDLFDTAAESDLMMPFVFDGRQWTVSIYTRDPDIDCSKLAAKYGGGGHRQAAGFQCKELPFKLSAPFVPEV